MKRKVFIHAGPGKTGTSTIQRWMSTNQLLLESEGFYYPHHDLDVNGISPGNYDSILSMGENNRWVVDAVKINQIKSNFDNGSYHTLVLSSEVFIDKVEEIVKFFPDAVVVLYLRNPLEVIESNYNQMVKRHGHSEKLSPNKNAARVIINRFSKLLENLSPNQVLIKPYEKTGDTSFNLVEDFLKSIGLNIKLSVENVSINRSYGYTALEFKRLINCFPLGDLERLIDPVLQRYDDGGIPFSLMPEELFAAQKKVVVETLTQFISRFKLVELERLLQDISEGQPANYCDHPLNTADIEQVWAHVREENSMLCDRLLDLIVANEGVVTGNRDFHDVINQASLNL